MRLKLWHVVALALALGGCASTAPDSTPTAAPPSTSTATPSPQRSKITFNLEVLAKYEVDARINNSVHSQKILLGIGKATSPIEYGKNHQICKDLDPRDIVIPFVLSVTNTSAAGTPNARIGTNFTPAADATLFHANGLLAQFDNDKDCLRVYPSNGATKQQLIGGSHAQIGSMRAYSSAAAGDPIIWQGAYVLGVNKDTGKTSPPESMFLRLTGPGTNAEVTYTITRLVKTGYGRDGGVITSGPDAGTYYVPLGDTTPCAKSFAGEVPIKCGAILP